MAHSLGFYDDGISFWVVLGKGSEVAQSCLTLFNPTDCSLRGTAREGLSLGSCSALCRALGHVPKLPVPPPSRIFIALKAPRCLVSATCHRR